MSRKLSDQSPTPATSQAATAALNEVGRVASFPIVGIGASAGGLEAFTQLLGALPLDTGMGFVLVQHLDPDHESALTHLLGRATALPVCEIQNNDPVQPNHVYVIPRDVNLEIVKGILILQPRARARVPHRPIDSFFESLARDQRERAIGVVLSGTASDGTLGLEAIKAEGGITLAQDDSAKYDSMPRSAAASGCVDLVLPPAEIAKELARIAKHPYVAGQPAQSLQRAEEELNGAVSAGPEARADDDSSLPSTGVQLKRVDAKQLREEAAREGKERGKSRGVEGADDGFKKILLLLRNHSGVDFSLYKSTTIQRRIARRLVLSKRATLEEYAGYLRGNGKELEALYSDVLISVTSFFRNPEAFEALGREVFPKLLKQRGDGRADDPIRVWVLGCSTGQEAYSITMAFMEAAEKAPRMRRLQVFATDLNDKLLDKARHGFYARSLVDDITPERLRRFFVEEEGGYRVIKPLREMVVFARQNLISDPPFSRMDLISCRNLLIYLEPSLQKKALPTFHYALKPGGFLMLGASESIGGFTDLFEPLDKKQKIYTRKSAPTPALHLPARTGHGERAMQPPPPLPLGKAEGSGALRGELNAQREADRVAVNLFAPPGVLINSDLQVLQFRGPTGAYLEPPAGKASFDVLKMAREGLMLPLRAAINQARKENKTARRQNVRVKRGGAEGVETRTVDVQVIPLKNLRERCYLILFEEGEKAARGHVSEGGSTEEKTPPLSKTREKSRIAELDTDLSETREYLQSVQEQHEAANEELQAANEEVQSANEELQSINEELETSKEELESANEELTTVNEEMSNRNTELNRLNNDLVNLQTSTKLAILLLGRDLTIRRFSAQAEKQFDLLAGDLGRSIGNIRHNLVLSPGSEASPRDLEGLVSQVIASVREEEREVRDKDGRWYSLRVRPYMTLDNKVDGAVLVLVDIDALKRSEEAAERLAAIVTSSGDAIITRDLDGLITSWNKGAQRLLGYSAEEVIGRPVTLLIPEDHLDEEPRILDRIRGGEFIQHYETVRRDKDGALLDISLTVSPVKDDSGHIIGASQVARDITQRTRVQSSLRDSEEFSRSVLENSPDCVKVIDEHGLLLSMNTNGLCLLEIDDFSALKGKEWWTLWPRDARGRVVAAFESAKEGRTDRFQAFCPTAKGTPKWWDVIVAPIRAGDGRIVMVISVSRDITSIIQAEENLRLSESRLGNLANNMAQLAWTCDRLGNVTWYNRRWLDYTGLSFEEMQGWGWRQVQHPDHVDRVVATVKRSSETGQVWEDTFPLRGKDGTYRWFLSRAVPIHDAQGDVESWFGTNTDVTSLRDAEERLRVSEVRYRRLFEAAHDGILILDAQTAKIVDVNRFMLDLMRYPREHFLGKELWELGFFRNKQENQEAMRNLQGAGTIRYENKPLRDRDGRSIPVEFVSNLYREDGHHVIQCNVRDISERKRFADEREAHLTNEQLLRMEAETANRSKDMFLATLSHEMRTPLNAIVGWISILRSGQTDAADLKEGLDVIDRNTRAQVQLIEDVLDVSRIVSGKLRLEMRPCDLTEAINAGIDVVRAAAEARDITLDVRLDPAAARANCDAARIQQVVWNLLSNAIKFTPRGGAIAITLSRERSALKLQVNDNGQGIGPELLPYVFDRFRQADSSTRRRFGGLGLGLSIVKHLVEMHGGTVEVFSAGEGRGATFTVRLPIRAVRIDESNEEPEGQAGDGRAAAIAGPAPLRLDGLRVLVVDDEADARRLLVKVLEEAGAIVTAAASAAEAIEVIPKIRAQVLVSDIGMPDQDGFDLLRQVRARGYDAKDLPAVALTAFAHKDDRGRALAAGFQVHVAKPVDPHDLTAVIAGLAGRNGGG